MVSGILKSGLVPPIWYESMTRLNLGARGVGPLLAVSCDGDGFDVREL